MGDQNVDKERLTGAQMRAFMQNVLRDLRALEKMIADGLIESGVRRIGAEQEMFLVDSAWRPANKALEVLDVVDDDRFTTELGLFNLEANIPPLPFEGSCFADLEHQIRDCVDKARSAATQVGADVLLAGILPTLRKTDLSLENMTPFPRYFALNDALTALRGDPYHFHIKGVDELIGSHDSVMVEACNASFQVHFQVSAEEFARVYNAAQAITGPVLAVAANSPILFGKRLWRETRIALFQQAVDTRSPRADLRERAPRVSFGRRWLEDSVVELFREDIARFRALLSAPEDDDPFVRLDRGEPPKLKALCLHNGTVYRWNRACYGATNGVPHLRIENRVLPSGPTPIDEVANAAFWLGLMSAFADDEVDVRERMPFDDARINFQSASRRGLGAEVVWFDKRKLPVQQLVLTELLQMSERGLSARGVRPQDIKKYLGVIEDRVGSRMTGAQWVLGSLEEMSEKGTPGERANALTAAMRARSESNDPVHRWPLARVDEAGGWLNNYMKVEQFMTVDLFTVHADESVDLVANLMKWEKIRHVPVEDNDHRLVGLVSYRTLLRLLAEGKLNMSDGGVAVNEVMIEDPITVSPATTTLEATALMKKHQIGCLPVVHRERLVGIVTERDFMAIASELLEQKLKE